MQVKSYIQRIGKVGNDNYHNNVHVKSFILEVNNNANSSRNQQQNNMITLDSHIDKIKLSATRLNDGKVKVKSFMSNHVSNIEISRKVLRETKTNTSGLHSNIVIEGFHTTNNIKKVKSYVNRVNSIVDLKRYCRPIQRLYVVHSQVKQIVINSKKDLKLIYIPILAQSQVIYNRSTSTIIENPSHSEVI